MLFKQFVISLVLVAIGVIQAACGLASDADQSATVEAMANSLSLSRTTDAAQDLGSDDKLATAQAAATDQARSAAGTQAAAAAISDEEQAQPPPLQRRRSSSNSPPMALILHKER
ncbi:MAG: hypothetical protein IIC78_06830 [Chloroflexi bacterium]|nr:hypothetical protein [Chloroflexota bacterium]